MGSKMFRNAALCIMSMMAPLPLFAQTGKPAEPGIVARFQGTVITQDELNKLSAADLEKLEMQRLQFEANWERNRRQVLEMNLSRLLEDKLLQAEAAKRGISKEQLLQKEVQGRVKDPTDDDVKAYYEANKQRINVPMAQIAGQISQYLKTNSYNKAKEALVDQLKRDYGVTVSLNAMRSNVDTAGSPSDGPGNAPVTIVEFSDFQCPYCANLSATLHQVLEKYGGKVRLVFRNFPLSQIHPHAEKAAEAGLCAADQGQFWEMHDLMFRTQGQLKEEDLRSKAAQLKLNAEAFNSCLASGKQAGRVKQDLVSGYKLGVSSTPALFINGRFVSGAVPFEDLAKIIDEELGSASTSIKPASKN